MAAIMIAVALATLDTAIANTALPSIAADLHATPAASVWVINAYQLAMVATLLPFATLGGILGHRRVYIGGVTLFIAARWYAHWRGRCRRSRRRAYCRALAPAPS